MQLRKHGNIEVFDAEYFESKLPRTKSKNAPLWTRKVSKGELVYFVNMGSPENAQILIRSSIDPDTNWARLTGEDSIRLYIVDAEGHFLSSKLSTYVTRRPGWQDRLWAQMSALRALQKQAGKCPHCGEARKIRKVKKTGVNKGKFFASCNFCDNSFKWLQLPVK